MSNNEQVILRHRVVRTTSPQGAEEALDAMAADGFSIMSVTGGGADGSVLWILGQAKEIRTMPEHRAGAGASSGMLGGGMTGGSEPSRERQQQ